MSHKYILNADGEPEVCHDLMKWARWYEHSEKVRRVALDKLDGGSVSTVFLGLDHSFGIGDVPLLYETVIFGGPHADYTERYSTKSEALAGHAKAVELVRA